MFNQKMNVLFWMLALTSVFFAVATINFVPVIKFVNKEWTETILQINDINFIVLLVLGLTFAFITFYWIFKYFLASEKFIHSKIRKHFSSLQKKGAKINYPVFPKKTMNSLERWELLAIFITTILVTITILSIVIVNFSIYFSTASQREGIEFNKMNGEIINYPQILNTIKYSGLAPIFLAIIVGIFIIASSIRRKVLFEKINKIQIKEAQ